MGNNNRYDTLSQAVKELKRRGFDQEVEVKTDSEIAIGENHSFKAGEIEIKEYHRFEGMSNPSDTSVVYAIESDDKNHRGILIDAYGADASDQIAKFLKKVSIDE